MRHTFLVVTVKKWLKSVYIYRSYRKIKIGSHFFGTPCRMLTGPTITSGLFAVQAVLMNICYLITTFTIFEVCKQPPAKNVMYWHIVNTKLIIPRALFPLVVVLYWGLLCGVLSEKVNFPCCLVDTQHMLPLF